MARGEGMSMVLTPRISEKAIAMAGTGTYVFEVPTSTNKIEVAKAVEQQFSVKVDTVNMLVAKGKKTTNRYKGRAGNRSDVKKAMVKLKAGQSIKLFEESA